MLGSKFYLILDTALIKGRDILTFAEDALRGGIDIVELRAKGLTDRETIRIAQLVRILTARYKVKFIINDRVDIAAITKSDGVHLGQADVPIKNARAILGKGMLVGISCHSYEDALSASEAGADYIGLGPIYKTDTKPHLQPIGLEPIEEVIKNLKIPFFVIGGINEDTIKEVIMHGASRFAIASAICLKDDVYKATVNLKNIIDEYKKEFFYRRENINDDLRIRKE